MSVDSTDDMMKHATRTDQSARHNPLQTQFDVDFRGWRKGLRRPGRFIPRGFIALGVFLCGTLGAEILLRLIMPVELVFQTQMSPGAHAPDPKYGFVFTPNYRGKMFHVDRVNNVPLEHDEYGFRPPAVSEANGPRRDVILLGGRSMAYGYGVPQEYTLQAATARAATCPIKVYNAAWPGFDIHRMFHIYRDFLEPHVHPELVVVCLYNLRLESFAKMPENFETLPDPLPQAQLFQFMDNLVLPQREGLARVLGKWYYRSFLVAKLVSLIDLNVDRVKTAFERIYAMLGQASPLRERTDATEVDSAAVAPNVDSGSRRELREIGLRRIVGLLQYMEAYFTERGAKMIVVILPEQETRWGSGSDQVQTMLLDALADRMVCLNLHKRLSGEFTDADFLGWSHYGPKPATAIGQCLAEQICATLFPQGAP